MKGAILSLLLVICGFLNADTWYYTGSGYKSDAFTNTSYWSNGDTPCTGFSSEDDFVVENWKWMWTPAGQDAADYRFSGRSLTIGSIGGADGKLEVRIYHSTGNRVTFENEGLFLANGLMTGYGYRARTSNVHGKITVVAPESAPFYIHGGGKLENNNDKILVFHDSFASAAGTMAVVGWAPELYKLNEITNFTLKIKGPCDKFFGKLKAGGHRPRANGDFDTAVKLACPEFAGSVTVATNGILGAEYATNVIGIASLSFEPGSTLDVATTSTTNAIFEVSGSFSASGPVAVLMDSRRIVVSEEGGSFTILTVPASETLEAGDFELELSGTALHFTPQAMRLAVREHGERKSLVLEVDPIVKLVEADYNSFNSNSEKLSAFVKSASWSDGLLPHGGSHYFNSNKGAIKTPETGSYEFPGSSLTVYDVRTNCPFIVFTEDFRIPILRMVNARLASGSGISPVITADRFEFSGIYNSIVIQRNCMMELAGPVYGDGTVDVIGNFAFGSNGRLRLAGDNSGFTGKIRLSVGDTAPDPETNFQTLLVSDGKALGGRLDEMRFDALELNAYGTLEVTNSVSLTAANNRGIYINGNGRIAVPEGAEISLSAPLTVNGTLEKLGEGTLALGGSPRFGADGAGETPDVSPQGARLEVSGGVLKVASVDAVNGLSVELSGDAALALDPVSADGDFALYGIRNVKGDVPFSAGNGGIALLVGGGEVPESVKGIECALFTVAAERFADVDALVKPRKAYGLKRGWTIKELSSRVNEDGSVTKVARIVRSGFALVVR